MEKIVKNKIKSRDEIIAKIVAYVVLIFFTFNAVVPFLMLFSSSLSSQASLVKYGYGIFPREFSGEAYKYMWTMRNTIGQAYFITIVVTVVGTTASLLITSLLAFGLAQRKLPGKAIVLILLLITMLFNGGQVASYIIWTNWFHVDNTIFALLLPNLLMNGFTVFLIMAYYKSSISGEILDAAAIDGAGTFTTYFRIVLPLSTPILATVGLMAALGYWNDWTNGLYYIDGRHEELYSIQQLLNTINENINFIKNNPDIAAQLGSANLPTTSVRMAIAVIGVLPILIAYPFFQKYFAAGLTLGGVKG